MNYLPTVKIVVVGNPKVGKTTLSNLISDFSNVIPTDYRPTAGCRVLEFEKDFSVEQAKSYKFLKGGTRCRVQLWDTSGDLKYEKCWPAIQQDSQGALVIIDNKNFKYENDLDFWINKFCKTANLPLSSISCLSYRKTDEKNEKPRQSNQFPQLDIFEVDFDVNNTLPAFNNFLNKVLSSINETGKIEDKKAPSKPLGTSTTKKEEKTAKTKKESDSEPKAEGTVEKEKKKKKKKKEEGDD